MRGLETTLEVPGTSTIEGHCSTILPKSNVFKSQLKGRALSWSVVRVVSILHLSSVASTWPSYSDSISPEVRHSKTSELTHCRSGSICMSQLCPRKEAVSVSGSAVSVSGRVRRRRARPIQKLAKFPHLRRRLRWRAWRTRLFFPDLDDSDYLIYDDLVEGREEDDDNVHDIETYLSKERAQDVNAAREEEPRILTVKLRSRVEEDTRGEEWKGVST